MRELSWALSIDTEDNGVHRERSLHVRVIPLRRGVHDPLRSQSRPPAGKLFRHVPSFGYFALGAESFLALLDVHCAFGVELIAMSLRFVGALVVVLLPMAWRPAAADPVQIVAVGASNTWGWGVGRQSAFPAQLEALLRAKGLEAHVINAGVVAATTAGMLRRIDSAAPPGTDLVILQPGGNDLRFFGTREQRAANIGAIERRLRERGIKLIVFDPVFPPEYFSFDRIHFTTAAHAQIAAELVPLVTAALQKSKQPRKSLEPAGRSRHGRSFRIPRP